MGTFFFGFLVVLLCTGLAMAGLLIVRKYVSLDKLQSYHEVAGHFLSIIGTLYAVVLGFIVVDALNTYQKARVTVEQESNALNDIFQIAHGLSDEKRHEIQKLSYEYAETMINEEWATMAHRHSSPAGDIAVENLWRSATNYEPKTPGQEALYSALLGQVDELDDARDSRLLNASREFDPAIWGVLVMGAVFTVVFTYFFGLESVSAQMLMTALVTVMVALNLFVVGTFGYPFAGDSKVSDEPLRLDARTFQNEMNARS